MTIAVFSGLMALSVNLAHAQQTGNTTADAAGGAAAGGAVGPVDAAVQLDDSAFDQVDRSGTLGSAPASIGSDAAERAGTAAGGRAGGAGGFGGFGGFGGLNSLFNAFRGGQAQSTRPPLRTRLRSAVAVAPIPAAQVQRTVTTRLHSLSSRPQLRNVNVTMQGRTAVLTGQVTSDRDRRMSEMLIRLEPGVSNVQNEITLATAVDAN